MLVKGALIKKKHNKVQHSIMHCLSHWRRWVSYKSPLGFFQQFLWLTHWGRVTHICVDKLTIIGSDNGLSPGRRQAIIWTNAGILLIGPLGTNFSEILIEILKFSFTKMLLEVSSAKWRPFCLGLNVLRAEKSCMLQLIGSFRGNQWILLPNC